MKVSRVYTQGTDAQMMVAFYVGPDGELGTAQHPAAISPEVRDTIVAYLTAEPPTEEQRCGR